MTISLTQPYEDLRFMTPLSEQRAEALVSFLARDLRGLVLDVGCGWGELLLRVITAAPDAVGFGIDLDTESIEHARQLAAQRGLNQRVTLVCGDAKTESPKEADALICIGASQIWGPPVEDNQPLDYTSALIALRAKVPPGAHVVYGEGIWSQPPTPKAVAPYPADWTNSCHYPSWLTSPSPTGSCPSRSKRRASTSGTSSSPGSAPATPDGSPTTARNTLTPPKCALELRASEPVTCAATAGSWA
jgi:SAM-dependent methyltransferase